MAQNNSDAHRQELEISSKLKVIYLMIFQIFQNYTTLRKILKVEK